MYLEGSDQHRGWFQTSLLTSVGAFGDAPYRAVLTHGFLVDGEGRKMSKSLGNVVDPMEETKHLGADVLRLWAASSDYGADVAASTEILERVAEGYRRIRNTFRFLLGNVYDFDPARDGIGDDELSELDCWAMLRLHRLIEEVTQAYDEYRFHRVFRLIYDFCVIDMSAFYLDVIKDRLYTDAAGSTERRAAQTVLHEILVVLTKMLAPILSFTCEEIWHLFPPGRRERESAQLCDWPRAEGRYMSSDLAARWDRLLGVRGQVSKALEEARDAKLIGNSLEAGVTLRVTPENERFLRQYAEMLPTLFIVSEVTIETATGAGAAELDVSVGRASGQKCERCWRYEADVGSDAEHATLCARCADVVRGL